MPVGGVTIESKPKQKRGNPNWVKGGASPNPAGRAARVVALLEAFREDVPAAQALCRRLLNPLTKDIDDRVRLKAAELVLAYGLGRPPVLEVKPDDFSGMSDEELAKAARAELERAGNAPSTEAVQ